LQVSATGQESFSHQLLAVHLLIAEQMLAVKHWLVTQVSVLLQVLECEQASLTQ
jgi:hypothetical protein